MAGSEILFLAHRVPFPPDRGDKIRSHHILKALAAIAPVHVATFGETDADMACERDLAEIAASHVLVRRTKPLWRAGLEALTRGEPISLAAFRDPAIARFVSRKLEQRRIGAIYVFSGQMGQYLPAAPAVRAIVDLVDVDSAKFETYGSAGNSPRRWIDRREGRLLRREEARLTGLADYTLLVSDAEAALLRSRLQEDGWPFDGDRVFALGNGVDTAKFDPAGIEVPWDFSQAGPHFVMTGQMDYTPNIAAARRFVDGILPALRARYSEARFHVVGRNPPESLRRISGRDGVYVWGEVAEVQPFLAGADAVVAPLDLARGVQNKVLEGMAMGRPLVLSSGAATGIGGRDGTHYRVADSDEDFIAALEGLIADRKLGETMGQAARRFVVETCSWPAKLAGLPDMIGIGPAAACDADAA